MEVLSILGAVIGVIGAVVPGKDDLWQVVGAGVIGFASAFVAVAAVTYLWDWLGGDPLRRAINDVDSSTQALDGSVRSLQQGVAEALTATTSLREAVKIVEDTYRTGLRRFHPHASEFGVPSRWVELLEYAEREIDLMGWTLQGWWSTDKTAGALRHALADGVRIRVVVMDPDSPLLDRPSGESKPSDVVRSELLYSLSRFEAVRSEVEDDHLPGTLRIYRVTADAILWHICRTDDRAVCMPYLRSVLPSESPVLEVERASGGLVMSLEREFEFLVRRAA